jgi:hypothetical protein
MRAMTWRPGAKLMSIRQASDETGLPAALLRELIKRAELRGITPPGVRRVFVDRRDLDAALERWKEQP